MSGFFLLALGAVASLALAAVVAVKGGGAALGIPTQHYPVLVPAGVRVAQLENAAGVNAKLVAFLTWWQTNGPHPIAVAVGGGVRSGVLWAAWQAAKFATGESKAATLKETPHGRAAAIDIYPDGFDGRIAWEQQPPSIVAKFKAQGEAAEKLGLVWGGRWSSFGKGAGDQPHIEVPNWTSLPLV